MSEIGGLLLCIVVGYLYWQQASHKFEARQAQEYYQEQVQDCQRRANNSGGHPEACF
jgi:hypothetical protein